MDPTNQKFSPKYQRYLWRNVLLHLRHTVHELYKEYNQRRTELKMIDEKANGPLFRFCGKLFKHIEVLDKEDRGQSTPTLEENTEASWEEMMHKIKNLEHEMSTIILICNSDEAFEHAHMVCEESLEKLDEKFAVLRNIDRERRTKAIESLQTTFAEIQTQTVKVGECEQRPIERKISRDEANLRSSVILDSFKRTLAKFQKSLNEDETDETIYFLEITKASWEKQMCEIKLREHELTTVFFLGNDIIEDVEDIEKLYELKLKELNKKINEHIETDKAEKTETMIVRFVRKLDKFRSSLNDKEIGETVYFLEITKAFWEKQMDEIKQCEHELARQYLLGDDFNKGFEDIEKLYEIKLKELNGKINEYKEKAEAEKNEEIQTIMELLKEIQMEMQQVMKIANPDEEDSMEEIKLSENVNKTQEELVNSESIDAMTNLKTSIIKQMQQLTHLMKPDEYNSVETKNDFANVTNPEQEKTTEIKQNMEQSDSNEILHRFRTKLVSKLLKKPSNRKQQN